LLDADDEPEAFAVLDVPLSPLDAEDDSFLAAVSVFGVEASEEDDTPLAEVDDDDRESVMYQPLPLNTMPTGWMTLRKAPPHCSQVVNGASEKLWRFSIISSQAVHL
jgi:hypothetical protein